MKREAFDRIVDGFNNWLTFSNEPMAREWRKYHGPAGGGLLFWVLLLVAAYFIFIIPYNLYGIARDTAIRQIYPDKVQIVSNNNDVLAEFYSLTPVMDAERRLSGYERSTIYCKGVYPDGNWTYHHWGRPGNDEAERVVFSKGDAYAVVLVDYGDGVVYDLNLGRTAADSPFHLWKFLKGKDLGWVSEIPDRSYFR